MFLLMKCRAIDNLAFFNYYFFDSLFFYVLFSVEMYAISLTFCKRPIVAYQL